MLHRRRAGPPTIAWARPLVGMAALVLTLTGSFASVKTTTPMTALPVGAVPNTPNALPQGTILVGYVDAMRGLTTAPVYTVTNGPMAGCTVRAPAAALASHPRHGRLDLSGATLRCPERASRG